MRLFTTATLLALGLFWSYPFLAPQLENVSHALERVSHAKVTPAPRRGEPVLVMAPADIRVRPVETTASVDLTGSSEDPRR